MHHSDHKLILFHYAILVWHNNNSSRYVTSENIRSTLYVCMYLLLIMYYVVVKDQRREIPLSRLLKFSCQIAEGMGYLVCSRATIYVYVHVLPLVL